METGHLLARYRRMICWLEAWSRAFSPGRGAGLPETCGPTFQGKAQHPRALPPDHWGMGIQQVLWGKWACVSDLVPLQLWCLSWAALLFKPQCPQLQVDSLSHNVAEILGRRQIGSLLKETKSIEGVSPSQQFSPRISPKATR